MKKLKKKNLFVEINDKCFLVAVGEYDDELNFKITEKEVFSPSEFINGKIIDLEKSVKNLKKIINQIENRTNFIFSEVNVIINQSDFNCVNISGFKKLNGNQILSEDISYILNDIKSKLGESEKHKTIIHLFNTKFLLDNKSLKNLPIGLYGNFYSHQLTFFMMNNYELKNLKTLFNRCNLNVNKIILKSFIDGIKIIESYKQDTFLKIDLKKNEVQLSFFYNSAFCFFQRFNFGSELILKDIAKVCSLEIENVRQMISNINLKISDENMYVEKKYFNNNNFRKISLKHIIEISSARIEEMINIIFNRNNNLNYIKNTNNNLTIYFEYDEKNIVGKFKNIIESYFKDCKLNFNNTSNDDDFSSIRIFGKLLCKGWSKEAIPIVYEKKSLISRIFSSLFE